MTSHGITGACRSRVRVARNKELARRRAIAEAGLDRFGAMQQAGFDTMIRRPIVRAVRWLCVKLRSCRQVCGSETIWCSYCVAGRYCDASAG
eukprot:COSAG02_NODE_5924_length_3938_cov_4.300078_3_plen_92_part_00